MGDGWLETQDLAKSQYQSPRREQLCGVVELHTAEGVMDSVGPDTGAENVAKYITERTTYGSYHDICDSDSYVHLVDYDDEAFHDGTGLNPSTTSVSFACRTVDWQRMPAAKRTAFLDQGARRAADQARHHKLRTGKIVKPVRLTKQQVLAGETGFLYHGDSDPKRRSDPGTTSAAPFPWDEFIVLYKIYAADVLGTAPAPPTPTDPEDFLMAVTEEQWNELVKLVTAIDLRTQELQKEVVLPKNESDDKSRMDRLVATIDDTAADVDKIKTKLGIS